MGQVYFVRHGLMRRVGRFRADSGAFDRGQVVVVRSWRGTELGEVLAAEAATARRGPELPETARVLRPAGADDLARARDLEADRPRRRSACERVLADRDWPLDLIDVEPLLDDRRTVLHYLGPHRVDEALVRALIDGSGLDVRLEAAGIDASCESCSPADDPVGGCSGGGCSGNGGGCSTGGGCAGCGLKAMVAGRAAVGFAGKRGVNPGGGPRC